MIALNTIPFFPYENGLDLFGLVMFSLGSVIIISVLLLYYNKIRKSNSSKDALETPIYQSKDILLQSNSLDANFIIAEKSTSTFVKILVYILIAFVAITPLYQLLGVEHFL
ncbi:hypothetical protein [uncultured Polaribacter sp.]|uniref:hypothetical protein n=1 Tax=uncultured Polaribacter sp. TaxID=174711 RepID=UPI00260C69D6|nr:hypothetical protein [uncultured Polaribacter sp.]